MDEDRGKIANWNISQSQYEYEYYPDLNYASFSILFYILKVPQINLVNR